LYLWQYLNMLLKVRALNSPMRAKQKQGLMWLPVFTSLFAILNLQS